MINYVRNKVTSAENERYVDFFEISFPSILVSAFSVIPFGVYLFEAKHFHIWTLILLYLLGFVVMYIATAFFKTSKKAIRQNLLIWSFAWPGFIITCLFIELCDLLYFGQQGILGFHAYLSKVLEKKPKVVRTPEVPVVDNGAYRTPAVCPSCDKPL